MAETMKRQRTTTLLAMTKKHLRSLSEEILFDIFSRLPIKDIFRFRSVCKDWNKFITDPYFAALHHARIDQDHCGSSFLIKRCNSTGEPFTKLYLVDYKNLDSCTSLKALNLKFDLPPSTQIELVGSSNGLLCLCSLPDCETYYICNPLTKEVLKLPEVCGERKPSTSGFAFDTTINRYKVVRTTCYFDDIYDYRSCRSGIEIYTLGTEKWRRIENVPCFYHPHPPNISQVFVNGALHSLIKYRKPDLELDDLHSFIRYRKPDLAFDDRIGAIDINSENFKILVLPPRKVSTGSRTLTVLKESLCVIEYKDDGLDKNVLFWTMKDYGITNSWNKEYIVQKKLLRPLQFPFKILRTVKQESVLIFHSDQDLGYYDVENKEFKHVQIDGIRWWFNEFEAVVHLGSLISPRTIDDGCAQKSTSTPICFRSNEMFLD